MNTDQRKQCIDDLMEQAVNKSLSLREIKSMCRDQGLQAGEAWYIYEKARERNDKIRSTSVRSLEKEIEALNESYNKPNKEGSPDHKRRL